MARGRAFVAAAALVWAGAEGQELRINQFGAGSEGYAAVALWDGGVRTVWMENNGACSGGLDVSLIRGQDSTGRFSSGERLVDSCTNGYMPDVASRPDGLTLVVRGGLDGQSGGIEGRIFDAALTPLTASFVINTPQPGTQTEPDVAFFSPDRFIVTWMDQQFATGGGPVIIYGRVVRDDGVLLTPDVDLDAGVSYQAWWPQPAVWGGTVAIAWQGLPSSTSGASDILLRTFDANLSPISAALDVSEQTRGGYTPPSVAVDAQGMTVAWSLSGAADRVWARFTDPSGAFLTPPLIVSSLDEDLHATVARIGDGRSIIAWHHTIIGIRGRVYDAAGVPVTSELEIGGSGSNASKADVAAATTGSFSVVWNAEEGVIDSSIFGRRFAFPISIVAAPGPGSGNAPTVSTVRPDGRPGWSFGAYGTGGYGTNVGTGGMDADARDEVLTGPGPSPVFGPHVRAFERDGVPLAKVSFYAYGTLKYGVRASGAAIDGDAFSEIVTAPGPGAVFGPHVRGFDYDGFLVRPRPGVSFFAYQTLKYGARVVGGEMDGDGFDELLTAPGPGDTFGPQIRGFEVDGGPASAMPKINFNAFGTSAYGCTVGSGTDTDSSGYGQYGNGYDDIVAGQGPRVTHEAELALFDYDDVNIRQRDAIVADVTFYGLNVAGGDADAGDAGEIVTSCGPDPTAPAHVVAWEWDPPAAFATNLPKLTKIGTDDFVLYPGLMYGAGVAVGDFE